MGVRYIVRETGKNGGVPFHTTDEAIDAAVGWFVETGMECEIYEDSGKPGEAPVYSSTYTSFVRMRQDNMQAGADAMREDNAHK